jgi:hypothetical protein
VGGRGGGRGTETGTRLKAESRPSAARPRRCVAPPRFHIAHRAAQIPPPVRVFSRNHQKDLSLPVGIHSRTKPVRAREPRQVLVVFRRIFENWYDLSLVCMSIEDWCGRYLYRVRLAERGRSCNGRGRGAGRCIVASISTRAARIFARSRIRKVRKVLHDDKEIIAFIPKNSLHCKGRKGPALEYWRNIRSIRSKASYDAYGIPYGQALNLAKFSIRSAGGWAYKKLSIFII